MLQQRYVDEYVKLYETGAIKLNRDRIDLIKWIKRVVLKQTHFYFDEYQIDNCIAFIEKYFFNIPCNFSAICLLSHSGLSTST